MLILALIVSLLGHKNMYTTKQPIDMLNESPLYVTPTVELYTKQQTTTKVDTIVIGSRGSRLALWQANYVRKKLEALKKKVVIKIIKTKGDVITNLSFNKLEGKGFFTKEIEDALLQGEIDLAVHSFKDLPTEQPQGLAIAGNSYRETPSDWLVIRKDAVDNTLPLSLKQGAVVGTSSARRKAQLLSFRPDMEIKDIRGNVPTRVGKLEKGWDAVMLAAAGLKRLQLDLSEYYVEKLPPQGFVAAPAQGVLAYQIRQEDERMRAIVQHLHHPEVEQAIGVERKVLNLLGGGCQQPIGIYCEVDRKKNYHVWATKATDWSAMPKRIYVKTTEKERLAEKVVSLLERQTTQNIFISRDLAQKSYFKQALSSQGHAIHDLSLLRFTTITYDVSKLIEAEWVFFSSPRAAKFFFEQATEVPKNIKFGAIGISTARTIQKYTDYEPEYIGRGNNVLHIAEQFGQVAEGQKVIFPHALHSLKTVQKYLKDRVQTQNLVVYKNEPLSDFEVPKCDILVFTSPMNARTYCSKYKILPHQKIVAMGSTTGKTLSSLGYPSYTTPYAPDEVSLVDVCYK